MSSTYKDYGRLYIIHRGRTYSCLKLKKNFQFEDRYVFIILFHNSQLVSFVGFVSFVKCDMYVSSSSKPIK